MRVLDRNADIETRYGGGFVQSIDGLEGDVSDGRRSDWFFYVNGIESPIGAADFELSDGDRAWWDHRDWTAAMRVPAVVGSWPEPFAHGFQGELYETALVCRTERAVCSDVGTRLREAGAELTGEGAERERAVLVFVGPWKRLRNDPHLLDLEHGPAESGVFATLTGPGPTVLNLLNVRGEPAGTLGRGAGLVAAVQPDEEPAAWVVTGTDQAGVEAAAGVLGDELRNRYAVAVDQAGPIGVPVP